MKENGDKDVLIKKEKDSEDSLKNLLMNVQKEKGLQE